MTNLNSLIITNNQLRVNITHWLYPILIWLAFFPTSLVFIYFFNYFSFWIDPIIIIFFLPLSLVIYYSIFILFILLFAKLFLVLFNVIHQQKEGIFHRTLQDKDFLFYLLRTNTKSFVLKIFNYFPLPWAKILALKMFNVAIPYNVGLLDSYIESEFIEIGNNTIIGEGSIVMSSMILGDFLLVKKVILKDNCTIGAFSIVAPGTIVEEGAILGMGSYTRISQCLEKYHIHYGRPAKNRGKIDDNFVSTQK
ncbi:MAG: DapH/DapD/GlmU-related protein [Promethearchaeota archaeon]